MNCLFFYTRYNLHSVTSNATANAISEEVTNRNTAISNAINTEVTNRNTAIANAVNNGNIYSYAETFTGRYWLDGKPIYRKTFTGTSITQSGSFVGDVYGYQTVIKIEMDLFVIVVIITGCHCFIVVQLLQM